MHAALVSYEAIPYTVRSVVRWWWCDTGVMYREMDCSERNKPDSPSGG